MTIFFLKTHISNVFSIGKSTQNQYTKANPDTHNQYIRIYQYIFLLFTRSMLSHWEVC